MSEMTDFYQNLDELKSQIEKIKDEGSGWINLPKALYLLCQEIETLKNEINFMKDRSIQKEGDIVMNKECEKIITFNESEFISEYMEQLFMYSQMLIRSMFENKKIPEYFMIRTRDSLTAVNAKDMVLTWTTDEAEGIKNDPTN